MATTNHVQGWLCLLMTEDSSFHWRTKPQNVSNPKRPGAPVFEFVCVFGQDDVVYHHHERNHQGKENLLLFPASDQLPQSERKVRSRERLGGLLRFYHREAA